MTGAKAERKAAVNARPRNGGSSEGTAPSFLTKCFGNTEVVYSRETTAFLTDMAGTFMVTCVIVYCTISGYLFYRDGVLYP